MKIPFRYREAWLLLAIAVVVGLISTRFPAFARPGNLAQVIEGGGTATVVQNGE